MIKIGAVNCMDDWALCNEQQIQAFPSLVMYPKKQRYNDIKIIDNLMRFALSYASGNVYDLSSLEKYQIQLKKSSSRPWLISYCLPSTGLDEDGGDHELNYELNCLAIMLHKLVKVASINCNKKDARENLYPLLKPKVVSPIVFYSNCLPNVSKESEDESLKRIEILTSNYKIIFESVNLNR